MSDKFSDHFRGEVHRWGAFTAGAYYENPTPQMLDAAKALVRNSTLLDFTYVKTHPTAGRVLAGMAGHIRPIPGMQWGRAEQQIFGKKWPVAEENSASRARRPPVRAQRGKL